jgi:D-amino-acid oxidase
MSRTKSAAVLGAGVVGLTTALRLREAGWRVTIFAREQTPDTTSDVAAAFWFPYKVERGERTARWAVATRHAYAELRKRGAPGLVPTRLVVLQRTPEPALALPEGVDGVVLSAAERPAGFGQGISAVVVRIETPVFMPWLHAEFLRAGGEVRHCMVGRAEELLSEAPVVVNCAGVGAGVVTPDPSVFPIRGQVVRVSRPPGLPDVIVVHDEEPTTTYIVPRSSDCILGGTAQPGNFDLAPDVATAAAILERCRRLEPRLSSAQVLEHRVGLRPGRPAVRVELKRRDGGGAIVHHYGHGGAGFTLAWGSAGDCVALAEAANANHT